MMILWYLFYLVLVIIPFWQLLPRYGFSPYLAFLAAFPLLAVLLLWLMAFGDKVSGGRPRS